MTSDAVLFQRGNTLFRMSGLYIRHFMTAIAWIIGVTAGMAVFAFGDTIAAMIQQEGVLYQLGRRPGYGGVTPVAILAEDACVHIRFGMAPRARVGGQLVLLGRVAVLAFSVGVGAIQWVDVLMVKIDHTIATVVTIDAANAVLLDMGGYCVMIMLNVAAYAIQGLG